MRNNNNSEIKLRKSSRVSQGQSPNYLRVLTYHRIDRMNDMQNLDPRLISAIPKVFAEQMLHLKMHYNVVFAEQVLEAYVGGSSLPQRAVLITFDDAYCDFAENAWPVLKELNLPATLFVPTGYPDCPERLFWWDRLYRSFMSTSKKSFDFEPIGNLPLESDEERQISFNQVRDYVKTLPFLKTLEIVDSVTAELGLERSDDKTVLSWDELRELAQQGVTLGAHTRSHSILSDLPFERMRREVRTSMRDMKREIGDDVLPIFSYPNGDYNDAAVEAVKDAGFRLAFGNGLSGLNRVNSEDQFRLNRINITAKNTLQVFKLRLQHWFNYVDQIRDRRQRAS